jgi:putative component of toxin-antitoxin plasmid stabilization module
VIEIREYVDIKGRNFFRQWFTRLDGFAKSRITIYLTRLQEGNFSVVKGVGSGVFESRLDFGQGAGSISVRTVKNWWFFSLAEQRCTSKKILKQPTRSGRNTRSASGRQSEAGPDCILR